MVIEETPNSYGAYAPDVPGCVAVADTPSEVVRLKRDALAHHLEGLREDGDPIPPPRASSVEATVGLAPRRGSAAGLTHP